MAMPTMATATAMKMMVVVVAAAVAAMVGSAGAAVGPRTPLPELLEWKRAEEEAGRFTHFESGTPCACALSDPAHPFEIDCGREDMEHVLEAWRVLTSEPACLTEEGCLSESNNSTCRQSFYVVQSHHDHCSHSDVPTAVEKGYHDFDANCWHCGIRRKYTPGFPDCPAVDCSDAALADFAAGVLRAACGAVPEGATLEEVEAVDCCNTPQEQGAFQLVLALHDVCGPTAPPVVDRLLHDYEYSCQDHFCNSSTASYRADVCPFNAYDSGETDEDGPSEDVPCPDGDLELCLAAGADTCYVAYGGEEKEGGPAAAFSGAVSVCWWLDRGLYQGTCADGTNGEWVLDSSVLGGFSAPSEGFPQCLKPCPYLEAAGDGPAGGGNACILCGGPSCD